MDTYFKLVEETLSKYPVSWQKNYYENKKDLIIEHKKGEIKSVPADYNHEKNIITIYDNHNNAIVHSLFHMSFRDKLKVGKEIEELGYIYGNGVCFEDIENDRKCLKSLTLGFAEYLTRLCKPTSTGHAVEYFFIDLLVGIYGEEILGYSFCNDPLGFITDNRFYNMVDFANGLDNYYLCEQGITIMSYMRNTIEELMAKEGKDRNIIGEGIGQTINLLNESIIKTFTAIIEEYHSYSNRKIEKDLFIAKLSSFLTNPDYAPAYVFDDDYIVRKKLQSSIDLIK